MRYRVSCLLSSLGFVLACSGPERDFGGERESDGGAGGSAAGGASSGDGGGDAAIGGGEADAGASGADASAGAGGADGSAGAGGSAGAAGAQDAECESVTCDSPPAKECGDSTTVWSYAATGSCSEGLCSYTRTETACIDGATCTGASCACDLGLANCGEKCADTTDDPEHCGACGHSCLGGTCVAGRCQPVLLATGQSGAASTSVDATHVYWVTNDSVNRVAKGGGTVQALALNQSSPRTVRSDGTHAYWGGGSGYVRRVPVGGGSTDDVTTTTTGYPINDLELSGSWIYLAEHNVLANGTSYLRRAPKTGGAAELLDSSLTGAYEVEVLGDCAYYNRIYGEQIVRDCPSTSGPIYTGTAVNVGLAVDATGVYFVDGGVKKTGLNGGTVTPLTTDKADKVIIDDEHAYYIEGTAASMACGTNWRIKRVPKIGGSIGTVVESPLGCPAHLSVDAEAIYWVNTSGGQVMKIAK